MNSLLSRSLSAVLMLGLTASGLHANADNFANATNIPFSNWDSGSVSILNMTTEVGEPGHRPQNLTGAGKTVWWKWTAPAGGLCIVDTLLAYDDQYVRDPVLSVYTGTAVNALTKIIANDDQDGYFNGGGSEAAGATFRAVQGTTYYIAVDSRLPAGVNAQNHKVTLRLRQLLDKAESRVAVFAEMGSDLLMVRLDLSKTTSNTYTLKVVMNGKAHSFTGMFGLDGYAVHAVPRIGPPGSLPRAPVMIFLDGCQNGYYALSTDDIGLYTATAGVVKKFTPAQPNTLKGLYSASYSGNSNPGGVISMTASPAGAVTGAITHTDGTKGTFGTLLCEKDATNSLAPMLCPLYKNQGFVHSYINMAEGGAVDTLSTNNESGLYRPAAPGAVFMPDGAVSQSLALAGSTYIPPLANARALGFLDGSMGVGKLSIVAVAGELPGAIMENLTFDTKNLFKFANPLTRKPVLTLNRANGLVTGSVLDNNGKKRTLTGVLYRDGMTVRLRGHVSGTTQNIGFEVIP